MNNAKKLKYTTTDLSLCFQQACFIGWYVFFAASYSVESTILSEGSSVVSDFGVGFPGNEIHHLSLKEITSFTCNFPKHFHTKKAADVFR